MESKEEHKRTEGKRLKEGAAHTVGNEVVRIGDASKKFEKNPAFIAERKKIFDELYAVQQQKYSGKAGCNTSRAS